MLDVRVLGLIIEWHGIRSQTAFSKTSSSILSGLVRKRVSLGTALPHSRFMRSGRSLTRWLKSFGASPQSNSRPCPTTWDSLPAKHLQHLPHPWKVNCRGKTACLRADSAIPVGSGGTPAGGPESPCKPSPASRPTAASLVHVCRIERKSNGTCEHNPAERRSNSRSLQSETWRESSSGTLPHQDRLLEP